LLIICRLILRRLFLVLLAYRVAHTLIVSDQGVRKLVYLTSKILSFDLLDALPLKLLHLYKERLFLPLLRCLLRWLFGLCFNLLLFDSLKLMLFMNVGKVNHLLTFGYPSDLWRLLSCHLDLLRLGLDPSEYVISLVHTALRSLLLVPEVVIAHTNHSTVHL
jgi:hypothetical protein